MSQEESSNYTWKQTWELESDPSVEVLEDESADNLEEALVDSDKAGQDTAPITGLPSTAPLEGLFQAGFLERPALPLLASELSAAAVSELSAGGEAVAAFVKESDEDGWSETEVEREDEEKDDDDDDDDWLMPDNDSGSPPLTTWAQGEGKFFRGNLGLLVSPAVVGEWWSEEESVVVTISN